MTRPSSSSKAGSGETRSLGVVSLFTALSRVLGMVRDQFLAARLGTGLEASAFVIAFTVPNLFRRLFGEGALSASFLPRFIRCRETAGPEEAWRLARRVASLVAVAVSAACAVIIAAGLLLPALVPSLGPKARLTLELAEIMAPYTVLICLAAVGMGVLNALRHYATPAAAPLVLNVVMILTLAVLGPGLGGVPGHGVHVLAVAVLGAGVIQLGMQLPALWARGWRPGWDTNRDDPRTREVLALMIPAAAGAAVTQLNLLADRFMAGFIAPSAPAALYFSERLIYLPLGVFAIAAGQVLLPSLARLVARDETEATRAKIRLSLSMMGFVMLPAAAGLAALALPLTRMLYGFGEFDEASVQATAAALAAYAPGLLVFSLDKLLVPVFYAHQNTRAPLRAGMVAVGLNLALNTACLLALPRDLRAAGLAVSTVAAHTAYILLLARGVHRLCGDCGWRSVIGALLRCGGAAAAMAAVAWAVHQGLAPRLGAGKAGQVGSTLGGVFAGMLTYVGLAAALRFPEWRLVADKLRRARGSAA